MERQQHRELVSEMTLDFDKPADNWPQTFGPVRDVIGAVIANYDVYSLGVVVVVLVNDVLCMSP